jgi:hypothetical protein
MNIHGVTWELHVYSLAFFYKKAKKISYTFFIFIFYFKTREFLSHFLFYILKLPTRLKI